MQTIKTRIADLKAGDIVMSEGGTFRVLRDASESQSHRPMHWDGIQRAHVIHSGPTNCARAPAMCIDGKVSGYFWPGSDWTFQGSTFFMVNRVVEA